ncbi:PfkB family carbohydrate kinase [Escherichia coli]|nr:PfkB family carbohydrate kinase [Escherichia coli]
MRVNHQHETNNLASNSGLFGCALSAQNCAPISPEKNAKLQLAIGNIELVKPNQKELSALVNRELTQPDDVRKAAQEIVNSGKAKRVVVSLGPQGALGVDSENCIQVVPPPVKSQSTVGAGDSMVGAMTLKLAENASLEEMVRFGVAAGSAATLNQGTRLCSHDDTQKIYAYLSR